jgi:hypothetical protein
MSSTDNVTPIRPPGLSTLSVTKERCRLNGLSPSDRAFQDLRPRTAQQLKAHGKSSSIS